MARIISYDRGCCCEREKEREILRGRDSARRIDATKKARYESAASRRRGDVPDESKRERERAFRMLRCRSALCCGRELAAAASLQLCASPRSIGIPLCMYTCPIPIQKYHFSPLINALFHKDSFVS